MTFESLTGDWDDFFTILRRYIIYNIILIKNNHFTVMWINGCSTNILG